MLHEGVLSAREPAKLHVSEPDEWSEPLDLEEPLIF